MEDLEEKLILDESTLKPSTPYMLRRDGKLFECGELHPYIHYNDNYPLDFLVQMLLNNFDLHFFYENTLEENLKRLIRTTICYCDAIGYKLPDEWAKEVTNSDVSIPNPSKKELREYIKLLRYDTNQEWCRVRTSDMFFGGSNNDIYFRITSVGFNWYPLIWKIVADNSGSISSVTSSREDTSETHRVGKIDIDHLPTDEFLTLKGNPVIEKLVGEDLPPILSESLESMSKGNALIDSFGYNPAHRINYWYEEVLSYLVRENTALIKEEMKRISQSQAEDIVNNIKRDERHDPEQFRKLLDNNHLWFGEFDGDICNALVSLRNNDLGLGDVYVNEFQSFTKGAGKKLLSQLLKQYTKVWLLSDPNSSEDLKKYYRQFGMKELVLENSVWGKPVSFFYQGIDDKDFEDKIDMYYGNHPGNSLSEAVEFDRDYKTGEADIDAKDVFSLTKSDSSYSTGLLPGSSEADYYREHKNKVGEIVYMTADEYYEACAKGFRSIGHDSSVENLKSSREQDSKDIRDLQELVVEYHKKLPIPYLDYTKGFSQEGLHRVMAMAELFDWDKTKFPVLVIKYADEQRYIEDLKDEDKSKIEYDIIQPSQNFNYHSVEEIIDQLEYELERNEYGWRYIEDPAKLKITFEEDPDKELQRLTFKDPNSDFEFVTDDYWFNIKIQLEEPEEETDFGKRYDDIDNVIDDLLASEAELEL